jgi:hypothetical protein
MFAPSSTQGDAPKVAVGINVQTSAAGVPIPIVLGTQKIPSNLIGYWDFQAVKHEQSSGKGGVPSSTSYTYSAIILFGLCEGPITTSGFVWQGKARQTTIADIDLALFHGKYDQIPWGVMTSLHPTNARAMRGQAYVCGRYQLGNTDALPNLQFEIGKVAGSVGPVTGTGTFAYIDAQDQLTSIIGTTILAVVGNVAADGNLIVTYKYSAAPHYKIAKLNATTLAVMLTKDVEAMTPSVLPDRIYPPQMNQFGDLAFLGTSESLYVLQNGSSTPVAASVSNQEFSRICMDAAGNFYAAGRTGASSYGIVKISANSTTHSTFVALSAGQPTIDLFQDGLGFLYLLRGGGATTNTLGKFDGTTGASVATYAIAASGTAQSIAVAGDGSVWFLMQVGNISLYRINPALSAETLIINTGHATLFGASQNLVRDWNTGDILFSDVNGIHRYNQNGTLIGVETSVSAVFLASSHAYSSIIYGFQSLQANGGVNRFISKSQASSEDADEDPSVILTYLLTDPNAGAGFPLSRLGSLTQYRNYCLSNGILLSPAIMQQATAASIIQDLIALTNSRAFTSQGVMQITPYGDQVTTIAMSSITGGPVTFTPNVTPIYDLTDDDFISDVGVSPITVTRSGFGMNKTSGTLADTFNQVQLEIMNRANSYNLQPVEAKDQANIETFGLRPMQMIPAHSVTKVSIGRTLAQLQLQRALYQRAQYAFTLGWNKILINPMDLLTLTDSTLGFNRKPVRVLEIDEDENGNLAFTCEDYLDQVGTAALYDTQDGSGFVPNPIIDPGSANPPLIFEPPVALAPIHPDGSFEVWLAVSGGTDFGGCEVWVSYDNLSYLLATTMVGNSKMGVLSATLNDGLDPDIVNTVFLDMSESHEPLGSGTQDDADNFRTLCYVDGEYISYEVAELAAADQWKLSPPTTPYLRRGAYGSESTSHAAGAPFVRIDTNVARLVRVPSDLGKTIYVKLLAFNDFGLGKQTLADADVVAYTYTIGGPPITAAVFGTSMTLSAGTVTVTVV